MTESADQPTRIPSLSGRIDGVCDEFERLLRDGQSPRIEEHLAGWSEPDRTALLRELLDVELEYRRNGGDAPPLDDYRRRFPEHSILINEVFTDATADTAAHVEPGSTLRTPRSPSAIEPLQTDKRFGDYELLDEIAHGGMGVVFRARDLAFDRDVAVKVLQDGYAADSPAARRFLDEARITGQLQHPAIPAVHHIGTLPDGRPFLAMKLIKGETLADLLAKTPQPAHAPGPANLIQVFAQICQAVAYAHSRKVIHRDLKPANVMVGAFGEVQVMDWGLAKVLTDQPDCTERMAIDDGRTEIRLMRDADSATQSDSVLGTPAFMAPEQAGGEVDNVDERSDVFGLGAVLCAILTGKPPYTGPNPQAVRLKALRGETADALARLDACDADRELVELCKSCLSAAREDRPRDAGEVAAAVTAHLSAAEERARQAELARVRSDEQRKRRRVQLSLVAAMLGIVIIAYSLLVVRSWQNDAEYLKEIAVDEASRALKAQQEANNQLQEAERQKRIAEEQEKIALAAENTVKNQMKIARGARAEAERLRDELDQVLYIRRVNLALPEWKDNEPARARQLLRDSPRKRRGWEWHYAHRVCHPELLTLKGHTGTLTSVAFSPDGKRLASAGQDHTVKVWDAVTGRETLTLKGHTASVWRVAFSPDGQRLASASFDHTVKVWDAATGRETLTLKGHNHWVTSVAFSPDGKRLASAGQDHTVKVWDAVTGRETLTLKGHTAPVWRVAFSPDGKRLASASWDATVKLWDAATGRETLTLKGHAGFVNSVAFSPDGKRLASAGHDQTVKLWDAATGRETLTLKGHTAPVWSVAFSPDGKRLASAGQDHTVKVWDAVTGRETLTLKGHTAPVWRVAFSPDGKRLASASWDATVKLWDAATGRETLTLKGHAGFVNSVAFSPDGKRLASAGHDQTVKLWDAATGRETLTLKGHTARVWSVAFSPDGKRLASASEDTTVKVWDAATGRETLTLKGHTRGVSSVAFSPDGKRLASASKDTTVKVWDAATGRETLTLKGHTDYVRSVAFSPDGKRLASAGHDQTVKLWDAATSRETLTLKGHKNIVTSVAFSPDGKRLASASLESTLKMWDARSDEWPDDRSLRPAVVARRPKVPPPNSKPLSVPVLSEGSASSWSPDCAQIVTGIRAARGLEIINPSTRKKRVLVTDGKDPDWSSKGLIAYVRQQDALKEEIWVVNADGTNNRKIADGGYPHWSADGKTLYFHSRKAQKIHSIDITQTPIIPTDVFEMKSTYYPAVSPDGRQVAYMREGRLIVAQIRDGKIMKDVPLKGWYGFLPRWSPDGRYLGFGSYGGTNVVGLWLLDMKTGMFTQVTPAACTLPAWSKDGSKLSFDYRPADGRTAVWMIDTDQLRNRKAFDRPGQ